jgi:histidinol-phosphatase (PHP family)
MKTGAFPGYLEEIEQARHAFPDLEINSGLEVDYIPDTISPRIFAPKLDYTIGSIHFVDGFEGKFWEIDNTFEVFNEGLSTIFGGDVRAALARYYHLTREMIVKGEPDVLGHMDKIKINASRFFDESERWYRDEIDKTLKIVSETGTIVEVNTRGIYKKKSESTYPGAWILERILHQGIPITMSSDAHHPEDLVREFEPTRNMLADLGFKNICVLKKGIWKNMPLSEYGKDR